MAWSMRVGDTVYTIGPDMRYIGRVVEILPGRNLVLENASWVADSGRLSEFIRTGRADPMESELVGDVQTFYNDVIRWPHPLPTESI